MKSNTKYKGKLNAIGKDIRKYRQKLSLSQPQICSQMQLIGIDMTINSLNKIETGDRIIKEYELAGFSKIFGISSDELLKNCLDELSK